MKDNTNNFFFQKSKNLCFLNNCNCAPQMKTDEWQPLALLQFLYISKQKKCDALYEKTVKQPLLNGLGQNCWEKSCMLRHCFSMKFYHRMATNITHHIKMSWHNLITESLANRPLSLDNLAWAVLCLTPQIADAGNVGNIKPCRNLEVLLKNYLRLHREWEATPRQIQVFYFTVYVLWGGRHPPSLCARKPKGLERTSICLLYVHSQPISGK